MLRTLTRQTLAVAVAVAVVVSFVGAPVAAAAALDTDSDGTLSSLSDDSTSSDGTTDDSGDDSNTDDDNQTDDGTDTDDGSTDNETSDDGNSSDDGSTDDDSSDDRSLGSDDGDDSTDNDSDDSSDDRSLGSDDGDDSADNDSDDRRTEEVEDAVNGTAEIVENTTEGLEDSTDSLDDDDGVVETADGILASVSEVAVDLTTIDFDNPFDADGGDDTEQTYDDSARDNHHEPPSDDDTGDDIADTDADDAATAAGTGDGDGDGPDPADPAGAGAAIGLGAVATAAALRGSPVVAGSKAASSGGVLSTLLDKVRPFVFPLRYSRYDDSDPLEHEARERVYQIVNETPGSYLSEVSKEADLPLSTTRHHIKVLEREDLVTGAKLHGKRRFYPAYAEGIELAAALNDDSTANIIDAIARIGAASVSDLADELGRDPSTISHHLQRLEDDGVITRERDGRAVVNKLSAEARTALEPEATAAGEAGEVVAGGAD